MVDGGDGRMYYRGVKFFVNLMVSMVPDLFYFFDHVRPTWLLVHAPDLLFGTLQVKNVDYLRV